LRFTSNWYTSVIVTETEAAVKNVPKSGKITPKIPNTILIYVPGLPPQEGCEKKG